MRCARQSEVKGQRNHRDLRNLNTSAKSSAADLLGHVSTLERLLSAKIKEARPTGRPFDDASVRLESAAGRAFATISFEF